VRRDVRRRLLHPAPGRAPLRIGGFTAPRRAVAALALASLAAAAAPARAQVGHEPGRSPFRDVTTRQSLSLGVGRFGGNPAAAGVGWRAGTAYAGRFETRLSGALGLSASAALMASSRYRINPEKDSATRVSGPFDHALLMADLSLALSLTGAKTWRGLAPYVALGAGWMTPLRTEADTGGYKAGSNFTLVPTLGARLFLGRSWAVRVELRDYLFRYEWPMAYYRPADANGNEILPHVLPDDAKDKPWVHNAALTIGVSYGFNF